MMATGNSYFRLFDYSIFKVVTGSMEPTIKENDVIIVKSVDNYEVDDIVTYSSADSFITHRIVQITNENYITKGDNNNTNDPAIKKDVVIGKVVSILGGLGIWQEILSKPSVLALIFTTLILFDFAFSYQGKQEEKKEIVDSLNIDTLKDANKEASSETRLSDEEINRLFEKIEEMQKEKRLNEKNLDSKEKEFLDYTIGYTIRLDINKVQEEIDTRLKK